MRAADGVGDGMERNRRTEIGREDDEGGRRWRRAGGNITQHAFMRDADGVRRNAVFELVNRQRNLRQQENRRNKSEEFRPPGHARHRRSSSARPRISAK